MSKDSLMNAHTAQLASLDQKMSDFIGYQKETNGRIMEKQDYTNGRVNNLERDVETLGREAITKDSLPEFIQSNFAMYLLEHVFRSKLFWLAISAVVMSPHFPTIIKAFIASAVDV